MSVRRLAAVLALSLFGSCYPYQQYYFVGHVFDGVTGAQVTKFGISVEYMTTTVAGTVDGTGYYSVGPIPPLQDFVVTITAQGYRPFMSPNSMHPDPASKTQVSYYYDAYLFPTDVQSPAVTLNISEQGSATAPSGSVRLQPRLPSATYGLTPVDIGGDGGSQGPQVWANADDLQASTFSQNFTNGALSVAAGALVWGVAYDVTIYNVPDCAEFDTKSAATAYVAGVDGDASYVLTPLVQAPLAIVFNSAAQPNTLTTDYSLTLQFNQPIAQDMTIDPNIVTFALNQAFSIDSPHVDMNGMGNSLTAPPANMMPFDFRGVDYSFAGSTLTLTWDQANGLAMTDPGDPIYSATYGGLGALLLRGANDETDPSVTLSSLLGGQSVTVQGVASQNP